MPALNQLLNSEVVRSVRDECPDDCLATVRLSKMTAEAVLGRLVEEEQADHQTRRAGSR